MSPEILQNSSINHVNSNISNLKMFDDHPHQYSTLWLLTSTCVFLFKFIFKKGHFIKSVPLCFLIHAAVACIQNQSTPTHLLAASSSSQCYLAERCHCYWPPNILLDTFFSIDSSPSLSILRKIPGTDSHSKDLFHPPLHPSPSLSPSLLIWLSL